MYSCFMMLNPGFVSSFGAGAGPKPTSRPAAPLNPARVVPVQAKAGHL